jgi:KaiC/GvpD/RAD55 family RecA-like ATPase
MVRDQGHEWIDPGVEQFERCETVVINPEEDSSPAAPLPLDKFSLRGQLPRLEELSKEQVQLLYGIALSGQATVIYASPNTGKTLLVLHLLLDGIRRGVINSAMLYYINVDDTLSGLRTKLEFAEEHGFHMLSEGYRDFSATEFLETLHEVTVSGQANGVVIILDTLKKFADLMDKRKASTFSKYIRQFVLQGGTVIALAHTNKNPGPDGKPRYAGTTDIVDDFDCAYTLAEVSTSEETQEKVVEFRNIKRRGDVVRRVAYSYSIEDGLSYGELLLSVKKVDDTQLVAVKKAEELKSDAEVITAVITCIRDGVNTKMRLVEATAERAGTSKRNALKVLEKYTGDDPDKHRWTYQVANRGAKIFKLINGESS